MEIKILNNPSEVFFETINEGECFIYDNVVYMKIPEIKQTTGEFITSVNAIKLCNGILTYFPDNCPVYKCNATLEVSRDIIIDW